MAWAPHLLKYAFEQADKLALQYSILSFVSQERSCNQLLLIDWFYASCNSHISTTYVHAACVVQQLELCRHLLCLNCEPSLVVYKTAGASLHSATKMRIKHNTLYTHTYFMDTCICTIVSININCIIVCAIVQALVARVGVTCTHHMQVRIYIYPTAGPTYLFGHRKAWPINLWLVCLGGRGQIR